MGNKLIKIIRKHDTEYLSKLKDFIWTSPIIPNLVDESYYFYKDDCLLGIILVVNDCNDNFFFFIVYDIDFPVVSGKFIKKYYMYNNLKIIKIYVLDILDTKYFTNDESNMVVNAHYRNYFKINGLYHDIFELLYFE